MPHEQREPEQTSIKLPSVRVGLGTLFTIVITGAGLCGTIVWAIADKHNSEMFVPRNEYSKDQQYLATSIQEIRVSQNDMKKDFKSSQEEMRTDIKQLLKESKK